MRFMLFLPLILDLYPQLRALCAPAQNSRSLRPTNSSTVLREPSLALENPLCLVRAAETPLMPPCETSRCLPLSASFDEYGRSEPSPIRSASNTRALAMRLPFPNPIPDKPTTAECAQRPQWECSISSPSNRLRATRAARAPTFRARPPLNSSRSRGPQSAHRFCQNSAN